MKHIWPLVHNHIPTKFLVAWSAQSWPKDMDFEVYFKLSLQDVHPWTIVHYFLCDQSVFHLHLQQNFDDVFNHLKAYLNKLIYCTSFVAAIQSNCASFTLPLPFNYKWLFIQTFEILPGQVILCPCLSSELTLCQNNIQTSQANLFEVFLPSILIINLDNVFHGLFLFVFLGNWDTQGIMIPCCIVWTI